MISITQRIIDWWQRPPARQRILHAIDEYEWRSGLDIMLRAKFLNSGANYHHLMLLEQQGLIESRWDEGPIPTARAGRRRRLYRRAT